MHFSIPVEKSLCQCHFEFETIALLWQIKWQTNSMYYFSFYIIIIPNESNTLCKTTTTKYGYICAFVFSFFFILILKQLFLMTLIVRISLHGLKHQNRRIKISIFNTFMTALQFNCIFHFVRWNLKTKQKIK